MNKEESVRSPIECKLLQLTKKKETIFLRIQNTYDLIPSLSTPKNQECFLARCLSIDNSVQEFNALLDQINELELQKDPCFEPNYSALSALDDLVCYITAAKQKLIAEKAAESPQVSPTKESLFTPSVMYHHSQRFNVLLPPLEIEPFSGKISEWPKFKNLITSLIINDKFMTTVQKSHYLHSLLKDPASRVVKAYQSSFNFDLAWEALCKRYESERVLANHFLQEIMKPYEPPQRATLQSLQDFISKVGDNINSLKSLGIQNLAEFVLFNMSIRQLDVQTRQDFELEVTENSFPTCNQLLAFVNKRCRMFELSASDVPPTPKKGVSVCGSGQGKSNKQVVLSTKPQSTVSSPKISSSINNPYILCPLSCSVKHPLYRCPEFIKKTPHERNSILKEVNGCFNCLSLFHLANQCPSPISCSLCKGRHHRLLHFPRKLDSNLSTKSGLTTESNIVPDKSNTSQLPSSNISLTTSVNSSINNIKSASNQVTEPIAVLLGTAVAQIRSSSGRFVKTRLIIDCGSTSSFISSDLARRLKLPVSECVQQFSGLNSTSVGNTNGVMKCTIKPRLATHPQLSTSAFIVENIVGTMPSVSIPVSIKKKFLNFNLADPNFDQPGTIDFLLGSDLFCKILSPHQYSANIESVSILSTVFGAIVMGPVPLSDKVSANPISLTTYPSDDCALNQIVQKFWEREEISEVKPSNPEDVYCEEQFVKTHRRDESGRYVVKLPFKVDPQQLEFPESHSVALQRFLSLEKRLSRDANLKQICFNFLHEYEALGHMQIAKNPGKYFIPYFCVFNESSLTTKARIVFDASACKSHIPLNKVLLSGPKLQKDISFIVIKFRTHRFVFTCDMEKMYRQILVDESDCQFQHIFFRQDPIEPLQEMELKTVTYGLTPSAFLAQRVLLQIAKDEGHKFPLGASVLEEDGFVDDLLCGRDSISELIELKNQVCGILQCAGISLNKWSSNSPEFLQQLRLDSVNKPLVICNESDLTVKVLGVMWNPTSDSFGFRINSPPSKCTKRTVLSTIARFFDPLGFAAPLIFKLKCFLQDLWKNNFDWDETLPSPFHDSWIQIVSEFPVLRNISIPRYISSVDQQSCLLLGFCDASQQGYCACVYLRVVFPCSKVQCSLLIAKTKVAPLKVLSIPRLELLGALLLARLIDSLKPTFKYIKAQNILLFSDSSIVLSWLRKPPHTLQTFVSNRVVKILELTDLSVWNHIGTTFNPADIGSRGLSPQGLLDNQEWFNAPSWCYSDVDVWPSTKVPPPIQDELPEVKVCHNVLVTSDSRNSSCDFLTEKYSSLSRLQRVCAYLMRFISNCRVPSSERVSGPLTVKECKTSLKTCVRLVQQKHFFPDMIKLSRGESVSQRFQSLSVFLDQEGLLRVGGRLAHSSLGYEARHPYLLPKKSHFTSVLIEYYHRTYLHAGPRTVRALIQREYWIINAHSAIRHCIFQCVRCRKFNASTLNPLMGDLPSPRVTPSRAFTHVSVDFAGPFLLKESLRRNAKIYKGYFAVFVCLATKACHLEAVTSLEAEAFIKTLQCFVSRRGLCSHIYCDQGTNFKGASRLLKEVTEFLRLSSNQELITNALACQNIQFHFQVAHAPFMNGLSESHVKNVKFHLYREIGNRVLTLEEFITILAKTEAILNSRPLYQLSSSPSDFSALTPGHFLTGGPLCALPEVDVAESKQNRLNRWEVQNQITQRVWKRWQNEYLHTLQQKNKWFQGDRNLDPGQLVWIKEDNASPLTYPLGRVKSVNVGLDGVVRSAVVTTSTGDYGRPVRKLAPLFPPQ